MKMKEYQPLFFTFEGPEGAGKTTQISSISQQLSQLGIAHLVVREPGGTQIGQRIRELLLDAQWQEMTAQTEIFLFAASRAQLVAEKIKPALQAGKVVLCDRYVDSSIAYQSYGEGAARQEVVAINRLAIDGCWPIRTYLLDLPWEKSQTRLQRRGQNMDRQEAKEKAFHQRVRAGYQALAEEERERFLVLDALLDREQITQLIWQDLLSYLKMRA